MQTATVPKTSPKARAAGRLMAQEQLLTKAMRGAKDKSTKTSHAGRSLAGRKQIIVAMLDASSTKHRKRILDLALAACGEIDHPAENTMAMAVMIGDWLASIGNAPNPSTGESEPIALLHGPTGPSTILQELGEWPGYIPSPAFIVRHLG